MFPGYEYILAFIFLLCTAAAGVTSVQNTMLAPSYSSPSFISK